MAGEPYHMHPREVGLLTIGQLRDLLCPEEELTTTLEFETRGALEAYQRDYADWKQQQVQKLINGERI